MEFGFLFFNWGSCIKKTIRILNQEGQTAVEYLMLILVVSMMMLTVLGRVKGRMVDDPNSLLGQFLATDHFVGDYKIFLLRR